MDPEDFEPRCLGLLRAANGDVEPANAAKPDGVDCERFNRRYRWCVLARMTYEWLRGCRLWCGWRHGNFCWWGCGAGNFGLGS